MTKLIRSMHKLPREFYARRTEVVARDLLGTLLVHRTGGQERIGRIVEVEAYVGPHDLAAHSSKGITKRTRVMYGPPGHAYVYLIYGMYHCMNVITEPEGHGSGVLLRALEPVQNLTGSTRGPGLLCRAMGVDLTLYGEDLCGDELFLAKAPPGPAFNIVSKPRIGVAYAGEWAARELRFYIEGNPYISKK
jgi:DNA-3-methyladenine glycosylase